MSIVKRHINYCPKGRGIRVALGYEEVDNSVFIGYFIGYCGGGMQCDAYFKVNNEKVIIFCENSHYWLELPNDEQKKLYGILENVTENLVFNEEQSYWEIPENIYQDYEKVTQNEDIHFYYESDDFNGIVLSKLAEHWGLLTSYKS